MREIIKMLEQFRDARDWRKFHTLGELARALSIEAAEVNELFLWGGLPELRHEPTKEHLGDEIADVMIYALNMCTVSGLDPYLIIKDKIKKNALKYPVPGDTDGGQE